jgi:hypothetical protein
MWLVVSLLYSPVVASGRVLPWREPIGDWGVESEWKRLIISSLLFLCGHHSCCVFHQRAHVFKTQSHNLPGSADTSYPYPLWLRGGTCNPPVVDHCQWSNPTLPILLELILVHFCLIVWFEYDICFLPIPSLKHWNNGPNNVCTYE